MAKSSRDNFSSSIKLILAKRASFLCSNPDCGKPTGFPDTNPNKANSIGEAAHICAASKGGKRYDENQSPEERRSIENGIWLCSFCATIIDQDADRYPKDLLKEWKKSHETSLASGSFIPAPPSVEMTTLDGLDLKAFPEKNFVDSHDCQFYRNHILQISNDGNTKLNRVKLRLQFPENLPRFMITNNPSGTIVNCKHESLEFLANASGGGIVSIGKESLSFLFCVDISELLPKDSVKITLTSRELDWMQIANFTPTEETKGDYENSIMFHITGSFQYEWQNRFRSEDFLLELKLCKVSRHISSTFQSESRFILWVEQGQGVFSSEIVKYPEKSHSRKS